MCCALRGGEQKEALGGGSGAAITSFGTLVFEKTATFKDTVDVSCDPRYDHCQQQNCSQLGKRLETTKKCKILNNVAEIAVLAASPSVSMVNHVGVRSSRRHVFPFHEPTQ